MPILASMTEEDKKLQRYAWDYMFSQRAPRGGLSKYLFFPAVTFSTVDFSFLSDDYERIADPRTPHADHATDDIVFVRKTWTVPDGMYEEAEAPEMDE